MKILKWTLIVVVLGIAGVAAGFFIYLQSSRPVYHGELYHRGVYEDVKVCFDRYGVPHIFARNEKDAYFTLGYLQAQERLFQMELLRRVGAGRLSEILGKDFVQTDAFFRTLGIHKSARESATMFFSKPNDPWQKNVLSYIKGINSFIFQGPTPPEFLIMGIPKTPFTPEDIYLITGYMSFSFAEALRTDPILDKINRSLGKNYMSALDWGTLVAAGAGTREEITDTIPVISDSLAAFLGSITEKMPVTPWLGSNGWAIAPSRSATGGVLVANDTHIGYQQPAVWFEAHVEYPGFSIYGNYLAGLPFPLIGHNRKISWGLTMFENDDMNLYREKTDSAHAGQYHYQGVWENFRTREETISIKGHPDTTYIIRETIHGAIINDVLDVVGKQEARPVALWWTYTRFPVTALQVTYELSHASKIDEARKAASSVNAPGLNIIYGDADGNIALWAAAKIPIYKNGANTKIILDGESGDDDIAGYYDFEMNPQQENPASGFVCSSNQSPDSIPGHQFPGYYAPRYRIDRVTELLESKPKWTITDLKTVQTDVISRLHPALAKIIIEEIGIEKIKTFSLAHQRAAGMLLKWNGSHKSADISPTIYYKMMSYIFEYAMRDELGDKDFTSFVNTHLMKASYERFITDSASGWWDNILTGTKVETRREVLTDAYVKAIDDLVASSGDMSNWSWGSVHTLEHVHPIGKKKPFDKIFNVGPIPVMGGIETINNAGFNLSTTGKYPVTNGPAMRLLIDMKDPENGFSVLPTGQSGHVRSQHYADQSRLHIAGEYRQMMMDRNAIEKNSVNILTFKPSE